MKSFVYALRGIARAVSTERNLRIHFSAAFYVTVAGILFEIERWEWAAIALACGLVIGAELLNTAVEKLCDAIKPERSPVIGAIKDMTAGAVLICAAAAVCVAVAVFCGIAPPEDVLSRPAFWIGAILLPGWGWFIFHK